jgi:transcriptional regulator with XRE-family HTH domain
VALVTENLDFAAWAISRMLERGISQRHLAERSGVDHSTISRILGGRHQPSHRTALRLIEVLESRWCEPDMLTKVLRRDPLLVDSDVEQIVDHYRNLRARREREAAPRTLLGPGQATAAGMKEPRTSLERIAGARSSR